MHLFDQKILGIVILLLLSMLVVVKHRATGTIMNGPYRLVRHPMYSAAMGISLGLAGMTQSGALFVVFGLYLL